MKIGIFGGTFNPPHLTHVKLVQCAKKQLELDEVIVVPCGDPPHKRCETDKYTRLRLTQLAFDGIAAVSDYEINAKGKSYTVLTLRHIKEMYPDAELYLIIGGDSLKNFGKWRLPEEIAQLAKLAVANRGRKTSRAVVNRIQTKYNAEIVFLDVKPDSVNSTEIRLMCQFGKDISDYVPQQVAQYIARNDLYTANRPLVDQLRGYLDEARFNHTYYVVKRGLQIAREDERDKVFLACLLHDCAKNLKFFDYGRYGFEPPADMPQSVIHSFLGAKVAQKDFGIYDTEILDAIAYHTTGRPGMTRLDKIVYVADKTEESRPYPKAHLKRGSLDKMFLACLKEAYEVCVRTHDGSICPLSKQTIDYYCK